MDAFRRLFALTCNKSAAGAVAVAAESSGSVMTSEKVRVGLGCSKSTLLSRDMVSHSNCEFSSAVLGANTPIQDQSHVVIGQNATFIGIYDGHGGSDAANYAKTVLFDHLLRISGEKGSTMSGDIIKEAISETGKGFVDFVRLSVETNPEIVRVGTYCLVGVIWHETLYVANLGDSRAVVGMIQDRGSTTLSFALPLTRDDHKASIIHDFDRERDNPKIFELNLENNDKFVIFASYGLWELLSSEDVVWIVHVNPRPGIAKKLVKSALEAAARRTDVTYKEIKTRDRIERKIHDDITVVVVFFKHNDEQPSFHSSAVGY